MPLSVRNKKIQKYYKKLKIHKVTEKEYYKIMNMAFYNPDYSAWKNMAICGVWLHAIQDRWSHGLESLKNNLDHSKETDDIWYDWDYMNQCRSYRPIEVTNMKDLINKNRRFGSMIDDTYDYLVKVKNRIKWGMFNPYMDFVIRYCNKNEVYTVVAQYLTEKGVKKKTVKSSKKSSRSKG